MKSESGFTIVELAIVITVIGILAAITVIAYTGIQDRARATQILSAFDIYEKALRQYKTFNGVYPIPSDLPTGTSLACLGGPFPAQQPFAVDECYDFQGTSYAHRSQIVDNAILTIIDANPTADKQYGFQIAGSISLTLRGLLYSSTDGQEAMLAYIIKDNQECGRGEKRFVNESGATYTECVLTLD